MSFHLTYPLSHLWLHLKHSFLAIHLLLYFSYLLQSVLRSQALNPEHHSETHVHCTENWPMGLTLSHWHLQTASLFFWRFILYYSHQHEQLYCKIVHSGQHGGIVTESWTINLTLRHLRVYSPARWVPSETELRIIIENPQKKMSSSHSYRLPGSTLTSAYQPSPG